MAPKSVFNFPEVINKNVKFLPIIFAHCDFIGRIDVVFNCIVHVVHISFLPDVNKSTCKSGQYFNLFFGKYLNFRYTG